MLRLVLVLLIAFLTPVILAESPTVIIDGNSANSSVDSPANLPLGTTIVLVCRVSGISSGLMPNFTWTCPNEPCIQQGYVGREIRNNILAINITSVHNDGTYTCTVSAEGYDVVSKDFHLKVTGGGVVHSYGRLILNEAVISDRRQLQPPNNPKGDGRIECRVSSGGAQLSYHGSQSESVDVNRMSDSSGSYVVIKQKLLLSGNFALEGKCNGLYHYLFLKNDTIPNDLQWKYPNITRSHSGITVNVSELPDGTARLIIGYTRLDLGVPVEGEYVNLRECDSKTFAPLVPGAKYRITAWGLGGGFDEDRRRSQSPIMRNESTLSLGASPPRHVTITRVFENGMELSWIPPREPNGDILCYVITYTMQNGTQRKVATPNNSNYHTLTGIVKGQNYFNISVAAFNGKPGKEIVMMTSYVHNPNTTFPCNVPEKISSLKITPIIVNGSAGFLIEWEEPNSTSEIIAYNVTIYEVGKDMTGSSTTTKNYQLASGLNTSTVYRVTVAANSMCGRGAESVDTVRNLSVLRNIDECPSIPNIVTVTFNSDSMIVSESETVLHIDVYRYGQMEGLIKLSVEDQNGTANRKAKRYEDYVLQSRYLYFIKMDQMVEKATVVVKIINNKEKESKECFELLLSTDSGDNVVFRKKKMTICIVNDNKYKKGK